MKSFHTLDEGPWTSRNSEHDHISTGIIDTLLPKPFTPSWNSPTLEDIRAPTQIFPGLDMVKLYQRLKILRMKAFSLQSTTSVWAVEAFKHEKRWGSQWRMTHGFRIAYLSYSTQSHLRASQGMASSSLRSCLALEHGPQSPHNGARQDAHRMQAFTYQCPFRNLIGAIWDKSKTEKFDIISRKIKKRFSALTGRYLPANNEAIRDKNQIRKCSHHFRTLFCFGQMTWQHIAPTDLHPNG